MFLTARENKGGVMIYTSRPWLIIFMAYLVNQSDLLSPNAHHWRRGDDQDDHEPCHESHQHEQHRVVFFRRLNIRRLQKPLTWAKKKQKPLDPVAL